jgi:hypothetical protein
MSTKNILSTCVAALVLLSFSLGCSPKKQADSVGSADTSAVSLPDTTFAPDTPVAE